MNDGFYLNYNHATRLSTLLQSGEIDFFLGEIYFLSTITGFFLFGKELLSYY